MNLETFLLYPEAYKSVPFKGADGCGRLAYGRISYNHIKVGRLGIPP
jgi:hypothetical protein